MAKKVLKKAQDGTELKERQYKRIGRIAERNPQRAERVAERMNKRASRVERGKEIANPPKMELNPMNEMRKMEMNSQYDRAMQRNKENAKEKMKAGGMIKRADGSMSKRGLWDNIRANKGSGKKPTAAMLKQEKKIKAQTKKK